MSKEGMVAVMQKVLMEAPKPPSSHNPSIPEAIDAVVLKALAKVGNDRFAEAVRVVRVTDGLLECPGTSARGHQTIDAVPVQFGRRGELNPARFRSVLLKVGAPRGA